MFTDLCEAKTLSQIKNALGSIPPLADVSHIASPKLRPESRLIMHDGVEVGMMTQSAYLAAKVASDHRIHTRVSNSFIETVKRHDFNPYDIRFNTLAIQPIEDLISKAHNRGTIQEFNIWKDEDGEQEVILIVRLLKQIIEDLLADRSFKDCQYLLFEMQECNGVAYLALPTVAYGGR